MLNQKFGGTLRNDAEIETALYLGKGKSIFRKIAYIWRSILIGHPFTDGNKRTTLGATLLMLEKSEIQIDELKKENLVSSITKVAMENITEINKIERLVRYAITGR